jgi:hypothetical protein
MSDNTFRYRTTRHADTFDALRGWLSRRPLESWLFFVAGVLLGTIAG